MSALVYFAGLIVIAGVALSLAARFHHSAVYSGQSLPLSAFGIHKRLLQASYMWAYYAWKPWWPVHLTPMRTELIDFSALDWPFIASAIGVVVLTVLLFMLRRRWPALLV